MSGRQRLHLDHQVAVGRRALTQLQRPRDHRGPAVWMGTPSRGGLSSVHVRCSGRADGRRARLTSPQGSDPLLQPVSLARLVLARILVDYCQVLVPVAPVHLIHPEKEQRSQVSWAPCVAASSCDLPPPEKHLKHQRRSGVPSRFLPTVTISPARKDLRRQTGKERSMSKMVVAHCGSTCTAFAGRLLHTSRDGPAPHLQLPDLLALLGHLAHRLPHQSDQHVQQQHEGEDDVGDQEDEEDGGILGAVEHVQLAHPDGQFEEIQQEGAEGVRVSALGVGGAAPVTLGARWWTHGQEGDQGCAAEEEHLRACWRASPSREAAAYLKHSRS